MRGSMNMQMSLHSLTHSLTHSEIHWLTITRWSDWLQVCDVRNTSDFNQCFWDCLWFTAKDSYRCYI